MTLPFTSPPLVLRFPLVVGPLKNKCFSSSINPLYFSEIIDNVPSADMVDEKINEAIN